MMRSIALVGAWLLALPALVAHAAPLLQGDYEVARLKIGTGEDLAWADFLKKNGQTGWSRMTLTFDGDNITLVHLDLDKGDDGHYTSCEAAVTTGIEWSAKGFNLPAKVTGKGGIRRFAKLTAQDDDSDEQHCSISLDAGAYAVVPGDMPKLITAKATATLTLRKTTLKVDWRKLVK